MSPTIHGIAPSAPRVGRYERLELVLDLAATYDNPYDPAGIAVDASFWSPSGHRMDVPGFLMADMEVSGEGGEERITPSGEAGWRVRFSPTEAGRWTYTVAVRDRSGSAVSAEGAFDCVASGNKGVVRVSRDDPRYFAFDSGETFFCIGSNAARFAPDSYIAKYRELFGQMARHRMNWLRVWIPNMEREAGTLVNYDQVEAYRIDALLSLAEEHGIYLDICMDWWRNFDTEAFEGRGSGYNPVDHCYWTGRGGQCQTVRDFFTLPWAKAQYKKRLRYTVARWGYSTSVFNWEFWNEIDTVGGFDPDDIVPWTAEMARELRRLDPWQHMIGNSYGSFIAEPTMWRLPEMDYVKIHGYWHAAILDHDVHVRGRDMGDFVSYWIAQVRDFGKPALQGEYGMVNDTWGLSPYCPQDTEGVSIHNGIWAALHAGSAGTAMYWWTRDVIMANDLYHVFAPIANYLDGVRLTEWRMTPQEVSTSQPESVRALGLKHERHTLIWLQNKAYTWWNLVVAKGRPSPLEGLTVELGPLEKGRYRIEVWDTHRGEIIHVESLDYRADRLRYAHYRLPMAVEKDVALKVEWMAGL